MCSPAALLRAGSALVQDRSRGRMASARSGTAVAVAVTFLRLCARITSDCEGRRSWPLDPPARGGPGALLAVEHHQFGACPQRRAGVAPPARGGPGALLAVEHHQFGAWPPRRRW